ncbi:MAG TPA: DUF6766 family protein [Nitrososphaeraceae archaeon]|nr:DUF6766 family protein [Nitrososphaeraceae archaeon]
MWKNKRGYLWITLALFAMSFSFHWAFAWFSYLDEQKEHNQPIEISGYFNMTFRDTMENWQSEFLQLIWQVAGLSILWYVGSPQSKESDERKEEKMDLIIKMLDPKNGNIILKELETKYPKK